MNRTRRARTAASGRGFTLIEIIVTLVIAGLLGALLVNMLGTSLIKGGTASLTARDSAQAESVIELVVAKYVEHVNANTSGSLAYVQAQYPANATLSYTSLTMDGGVDALRVTATVGSSSATTLLTQARTNAADSGMSY